MTPEEYDRALEEIRVLMEEVKDPAPESPEGQKLLTLAKKVEAYEKTHFPFTCNPPLITAACGHSWPCARQECHQ